MLSHSDLSIERVCLGTNMEDSNRHQGKSHVGENQEYKNLIYAVYVILLAPMIQKQHSERMKERRLKM